MITVFTIVAIATAVGLFLIAGFELIDQVSRAGETVDRGELARELLGTGALLPPKKSVAVTGLWLRTGRGGRLEVLAEIDRRWRLMRGNGERYTEGEISHIWEVPGIERAPLDPVTECEAANGLHPTSPGKRRDA